MLVLLLGVPGLAEGYCARCGARLTMGLLGTGGDCPNAACNVPSSTAAPAPKNNSMMEVVITADELPNFKADCEASQRAIDYWNNRLQVNPQDAEAQQGLRNENWWVDQENAARKRKTTLRVWMNGSPPLPVFSWGERDRMVEYLSQKQNWRELGKTIDYRYR